VVDTEDLPLNISRETLQENVVLRKIAQTVLRQVLGHLENLAATDGQKYERFWKLHGSYFKFAFNDYLNRDRIAPLLRFASSAGDALSGLDDYLARRREGQKDIWHIAAPSPEAARVNPHMERFRRKGIEVLYLLEPVDEVALEGLGKYKDCPFKSVEQAGAGDLDAFPDLEEAAPAPEALSAEDQDVFTRLVERIRAVLGDRILDVRVSGRLTGSPAVLVSGDGLSSSMEKLLRVMQKSDEIPKKILELNPDHPLMRSLLRIYAHAPENPLLDDLVRALFDNVLLLDGYLHEPHLVADRALKLMDTALGWYADVLRAK
jgi:molecular chaperone HtpG